MRLVCSPWAAPFFLLSSEAGAAAGACCFESLFESDCGASVLPLFGG
jgi:hypothetical protein